MSTKSVLNYQNFKFISGCKQIVNITVGVTNRCLSIVVHIFSLVQAMPLRPVGLERGVFLDAVGEVALS